MIRNLVLATLALSLSTQAFARSLAEIKKTGELRVCPSASQEEQFNQTVEEAKLFAASIGVKSVVKRIKWDEQFQNKNGTTVKGESYHPLRLENGECDLFPNLLTKNEWRAKLMEMVTYFPSRMMVIINKSNMKSIRSEKDLPGRTAAMLKDSSYMNWVDTQNKGPWAANPVKVTLMQVKEGVDAVDAGKFDFTMLDGNLAIATTHKQTKNSVAAFPVGPTDEITWGIRKGEKELANAITEFLKAQTAKKDSKLNSLWAGFYGMTLTDFVALITQVK